MNRFDYVARRRWFCGGTRITSINPLPWIRTPDTGLGVRVELVQIDDALVYQVPAAYRTEPFPGLEPALMAVEDGLHVYDGLSDAHARSALLSGFLGAAAPGMRYEADGPLPLTPTTPTVPLVAEQSNTSIIVGDELLWKVFRVVGPGRNPDIEIGRALAGTRQIASVRAWMSAGDLDLAMLYDYFPSATDGWDSARASFRDLRAEPDHAAADMGADFATEAERLGRTVIDVHRHLANLGRGVWAAHDIETLVERLSRRFDGACVVVPELAARAEAVRRVHAELHDDQVPVQRVHGDLHLGQVLRTVDGWKVFDFEGEPATPLADRIRLDSPLRDVAGMLRSFDYAARSVLMQIGDDDPGARGRAADWSRHNSEAFLRGYGIEQGGPTYRLLRSYQVDKAAYEVAYESHHRPAWMSIPLDALDRLTAAGGD